MDEDEGIEEDEDEEKEQEKEKQVAMARQIYDTMERRFLNKICRRVFSMFLRVEQEWFLIK